jgi:endonuclease/exonuclease/phosphatase family metal-dependent hydrolase
MRLQRIAAMVAVSVLALSACNGGDDGVQVRVMTQNLAVGIELEPVLLAPSFGAIPALVETAWAQKDVTDFNLRADRIAAAIQAADADLVGLQEVIQFFSGPTGLDPATTPAQDFLALLLARLQAGGLSYSLATDGTTQGVVPNADIELPGTAGNDYRVIDREAVIVKSGVTVTGVRRGNFASHLSLLIGGVQTFDYNRGWIAVDAEKDGKPFTLVSTHLEPFSPSVQGAQATELLALVSPSSRPTILLGDFNSDPRDVAFPAYGLLVSPTTGISDAAVDVSSDVLTCCHEALMSDPADLHERRVDLVLHSPHFRATSVTVHGTAPSDFASGLWPSDHAGVSAVLELE